MTTTQLTVTTMKLAQITRPGGDFQIVEREIPEPGAGHVRIRIQACGVCHSDVFTKEGQWPGIQYPRVPGHEVVGTLDELGAGVSGWQKGQRVGVGWHGGHDGTCSACRRGDFRNCRNRQVPGISYDGGYQQYMVAPVEALVSVPESLNDVEAAPLLCAGITTFGALRNSGAFPGDLVGVLGVGGLATSPFSGRASSAIGSLPSAADQIATGSPRNSVPLTTSTADPRTPQTPCNSWVAHRSSLPPPQAQKRCQRRSTVLRRTVSS